MKLYTVNYQGEKRLAYSEDGECLILLPNTEASFSSNLHEFITVGNKSWQKAAEFAKGKQAVDKTQITYDPPILPTSRIFCVGKNYRDHAAEMGGKAPGYPDIFLRLPSSFVGHGEYIEKPITCDSLDFEAELAVVIGRAGRNIEAENADEYIFAYTVANDVTVREWQKRSSQFTLGKNVDNTGAIGPALTAKSSIANVENLSITSFLNDKCMQDGSTSDMIFSINTIISAISKSIKLMPGDIILTGTPSGVGAGRKPQVFMQHSDTIKVGISELGSLKNIITNF